MFKYVVRKIFGTENDRYIKSIYPIVDRINSFESAISPLSDLELQAKTPEFRQRLANGESLNQILPEAFAVVREAGKRRLGMRHYDVQMVGGIVLHQGRIAEMRTGEGKTLVATLALYLNALEGKGSHLVTVNDYLASRDAEWMGNIYKFLGLSVGTIVHGLSNKQRRANYNCDISYGTNNEFGFDYLRDNMKFDLSQYVQRDLNFAIVDEVDSILIDEARTPLIISGPSEESTEMYAVINQIMYHLEDTVHFERDEKAKNALLTPAGIAKVEKLLNITNLYAPENLEIVHHIHQALKSHFMFHRDVDYVVKDGQVLIVDEFTGRLMEGRRYSDGLHQALEAKEKVTVESENQTLATITFQNYFRMYNKLAGMTGTADTEASEFDQIYGLRVAVIPTNKPIIRKDSGDKIYKTMDAKEKAVINEIVERNKKGQPVLVGTISVEKSERLHFLLEKQGVPHYVLNAKQHMREADIVAQAGRKGAVTIATNMAGRGTDIVLGGNPDIFAKSELSNIKIDPEMSYEQAQIFLEEKRKELIAKYADICSKEREEVLTAGGVHIIGTERHESRRIDNQLRGRSGRQGDPGSSLFFLSLEDDLLRIFGSERIASVMDRLGLEEDQPIEHRWISKAIENAQKKVEHHNFSIRKNVLEYDDVMNQQRKTVYALRRRILDGETNRALVYSMIEETVNYVVSSYIPDRASLDTWDFNEVYQALSRLTSYPPETFEFIRGAFQPKEKDARGKLAQIIYDFLTDKYNTKVSSFEGDLAKELERHLTLEVLDVYWRRHLLQMDHLREGIGLRGYGQKNPKLEYKKEGFRMFTEMMENIYIESVKRLFAVQVVTEESIEKFEQKEEEKAKQIQPDEIISRLPPPNPSEPVKRQIAKAGRNDDCPCGSGKKFKKCCEGKGLYD